MSSNKGSKGWYVHIELLTVVVTNTFSLISMFVMSATNSYSDTNE